MTLGLRVDSSLRRDVILGGTGDDILRGGAGEDWIFGNDGNDVLTGGDDRQASDLLIGGKGNDTFQIIPDSLPLLGNQPNTDFDPATRTYLPTYSDQFLGGDGTDRVLYLGGDKDRRGFDVPDFAALQYNTLLHRYEFSSLVWDIGTQAFQTFTGPSGIAYKQEYLYYQTRDVEETQIELRSGNDTFHANPGFRFLPLAGAVNAGDFDTFGIELGDFEQGATEAKLRINGGFGDDRLFGGVLADTINGGPGNDYIVGSLGDDSIDGSGGNDRLYGNLPPATDVINTIPTTFAKPPGFPSPSPEEAFIYTLAAPYLDATVPARTGVTLNTAPSGGAIQTDSNAFGLQGSRANEQLSGVVAVGDFNGDSQTDYVVSSSSFSYLMFGPVVTNDLEFAADRATIVIDHSALGVPADRFGDINGDGIADLAFVKDAGADVFVNIVFGAKAAWPRTWDTVFERNFLVRTGAGNNSRTIKIPGDSISDSGRLSVQMFETTGDNLDDVLVSTTSTFYQKGLIGFVYSGKTITSFTGPEISEQFHALLQLDGEYRVNGIVGDALVHRYSFNEGSGSVLIDSVAGLNGTIVDRSGSGTVSGGGGSSRTSTGVRLFGGSDATSDYLELPDNLLQGLTDATIEIWATRQSIQTWARLFDFGPSTTEYFMAAWNQSGDPLNNRVEWNDLAGSTGVTASNDIGVGNEHQFAFTIDQGGGAGGQTRVTIYRNSSFITFFDTPNTLAELTAGNNWLGRSKFASDSVADATYNELRVFNRVLNEFELSDLQQLGPDANLTRSIQSLVVGDVNGDGRDEILFANSGVTVSVSDLNGSTLTPRPDLSSNIPLLTGLPESTTPYAIRLRSAGPELRGYALGDLNNDGFDDFALGGRENLRVYQGSSSLVGVMTPSLIVPGADLSAAGGDFNGNGKGDIALTGRPLSTDPRLVPPATYVFSDVSDLANGTTLSLSGATATVAATGTDQRLPGLSFDSNGQDMALLPTASVNGLSELSTSLWFRTTRVGAVPSHLINGVSNTDGVFQDDRFTIVINPAGAFEVQINGQTGGQFFITPPLNDGEYHHVVIVVNFTTDQVSAYMDGGFLGTISNAGIVPLNISENYLVLGNDITNANYGVNSANRFDGDISNVSFWNRALSANDVRSIRNGNLSGTEPGLQAWFKLDEPSGNALIDSKQSTSSRPGGSLGNNVQDPASLPSRTNRFSPVSKLPVQPYLDLNSDGLSDLVIVSPFGATSLSNAGRASILYGERSAQTLPLNGVFDVLENWSVSGSGSFVKDSGTGQPVRFDLGGEPFTLANASADRWFQFTTVGDGNADNAIRLNGSVRMDLLDSRGGVILENQSAISMRTLPADTYYLRVYSASTTTSLAFTIDMTPPKAGQTHEGSSYPDRDSLSGGDGDDIIQGHGDLDRIYGGSGNDTITAELIETRDLDASDGDLLPVPSSQNTVGNSAPVLDPFVGTSLIRMFFDDFEQSTLDANRWTITTSVSSDVSVTTVPRSGPIAPLEARSASFKGLAELRSGTVDLSRASSANVTYSYQRTGFGDSPEDGNDPHS